MYSNEPLETELQGKRIRIQMNHCGDCIDRQEEMYSNEPLRRLYYHGGDWIARQEEMYSSEPLETELQGKRIYMHSNEPLRRLY